MFRRLFGTEKAREDSALSQSLKGFDSVDLRLEDTVSQSLPDLTIGPPSVQLSPDPKQRRGRRDEIRTERLKTSEDSLVDGSLCSEPGIGQTLQVNKDPAMLYSSIDSLLAVPKTEIKRVPHSRAFSMKKSLSSRGNSAADDLSDTSVASSPRNSFDVTESSTVGNFFPKQSQMTTPVKKSEENLEESSREGVSTESRPELVSEDKATKRANKKSRKQRYKTVTGSELLVPVEVQMNPDGGIQSDSESALTRSIPGWRSASLKGTPQRKAVETPVQVVKNEGTPGRALTSAVPISRLDNYVVLVSDQLDENGEIQAVKVDVSTTPLPLKQEDLTSYLEATGHCGRTVCTSLNNVAILLPSSKNSSSVVATSVGQFTNMKRVCIAKGNVSFARLRDTYSYSRYMFLTSDFLYVMKAKTATTFKLKKKVAIGDLWLAPGIGRSGEVSVSFIIGWPLATNYTLTFAKADQKNAWMTTIEKLMDMERLKESRREVIIQIVIEDTGVTVKKSLVVTCEVTVSQVIQKCLKELHLAEGDPDQYELCVKVKDSATPLILIGHEIPLYIQLKNSQSSHNQQVAAHHNDSGSNVFDHFILRQRKSTQRNGFRHHPRKGRRLTLTGLFGRKALLPQQQQQQQPDVLQSTPQAKLFGRSLPEVCSDEALPKPVMDLLRRLYVQGASTPGIFRKPGNQRDLQDLKARLDAGEECNMDDISIHVASSALKSFLRDLPDCVLLSNLYCKWIDVVCIQDNSEKQENTKRLICLLPSSNLLLLRHLVCVLHHISLHSDHNHMTSANLAICLGPTFLWPEGTVDLTAQFGSVELVARVTQMLIDDAQTILGSDSLELFRDLDDGEPNAAAELNFESEDSFGSHELINNKRDLTQGTSLESLDSASFDETQSYNAVQSQVSVDSGLAVSNPLLYDDPESPTATSSQTPAFEGSRYAKRLLGAKKKQHTKSELSDISEALTVLDPEERPNSKMAGATNVRRRIHRFQASKAHSDETTNDSAGDNLESSEDETSFARASISSSEYMADSIIGLNSEDALSRDLDVSMELEEKVTSDEVQRFTVDMVRETFRSERTERSGPSKTIIRLVSSTNGADKTSAEGADIFKGLSSEWYFTGPETQVNIRNLRSVPTREQKPRNESALLVNSSRSQVTPSDGLSSVGSKLTPSFSLRCDRPMKGPQDLKAVKQSSLDSVTPSVISCPEMHALQQGKKSPHDSNGDSAQFCPRLTGFQVLENVPLPQRSRLNSRPSSGLVSSDSFSRVDDRPRTRAPRERSVPPPRRHADVGVNVNDSCFRSSRGVQTDDCEMSVGPIITPVTPKRIATVAVGTDDTDGVCQRKENPSAYKFGRRYKSDLDLASNRGSWNQELADSYSKDVGKKFTSPAEQLRSNCESDGVQVCATGRPLRNGDSVRIASEEQQNHIPFQHQTPRLPVRRGSLPREPPAVSNVSERMQAFQQHRAPVIIEQRVRDRRAVTVVTIGDDKPLLPNKYGIHPVHQPMSFEIPDMSSSAGNHRLDNERGNDSVPSEPIRRNLGERRSNGFQNFHNASSTHESLAQKSTPTPRMLAIQPRSGISSSPFNSSAPQRNNSAHQVVAPRRTDGQGHVFGGLHNETPRNIDNHVYVPSSKTESPWKEDSRPDNSSRLGDGPHQRPSQHRSNTSRNIDSQRHPTTREVDSAWLCDDARRRDEAVRYVSAGPNLSASQPLFGTPRNTKTSQQTESRSADMTDEPSGVTWSVNELKKVFDSSKTKTAVSRK